MEALALGLPIVATAVGGIPHAVRDGVEGLLVAAEDPAALADGILRLVRDDHLRQALSDGATARGDAFSIRRAAEAYTAIYVAV